MVIGIDEIPVEILYVVYWCVEANVVVRMWVGCVFFVGDVVYVVLFNGGYGGNIGV